MLRRKKLILFITIFSVLALVLAGCGGSTGDNDAEEPGEVEDNGAEVEESEASLQRVLDAGVLTVVGSGGYPPFNYYDADDNVVGFDVDTGEAIAEILGVELNYETSAWDGLIDGLRAGHYDAILGSMAITDERLEVVNFTVPYYYSGAQLVVRTDSSITDPSEMDGLEIAVATGTTFVEDAEALGATVVTYEDDNQTLMELLNGRVDGVITDRMVAIQGMNEISGGENLEIAGELLRLESMGLAINKADEELLEALNDALEQMHADGTLADISAKWFDGADITVN